MTGNKQLIRLSVALYPIGWAIVPQRAKNGTQRKKQAATIVVGISGCSLYYRGK